MIYIYIANNICIDLMAFNTDVSYDLARVRASVHLKRYLLLMSVLIRFTHFYYKNNPIVLYFKIIKNSIKIEKKIIK